MPLDRGKLDALYQRYGFSPKPSPSGICVYVYRQGYFHGAEVVPVIGDVDAEPTAAEYRKAGYAVHVRHYDSHDAAEEQLFSGFFLVDETKERLSDYYALFSKRKKRALGAPYEYVPCPYSVGTSLEVHTKPIIAFLLESLRRPGPQLLLLEAAAGFGKTCTAYEALHAMLAPPLRKPPIFTELSRNRQARVFRYVLLDEIDRHYHTLGSELVLAEIRSGRLPVIIDGFDELLGKQPSNDSKQEKDFEDVENMLDTISELLRGEAKIMLTTRRTAIFAGDEFARWMESKKAADTNETPFEVTRVSLHEPSVGDWLPTDRVNLLRDRGFLDQVSNPVMLAFLRHLNDREFAETLSDADGIARRYFSSLLEREQERQQLRMSVEQQQQVFRTLAKDMVALDITSESRDTIQELILKSSSATIEEVRKTYGPTERPTVEEMGGKLASHALLDRIGSGEGAIGFINKFVFGTLIADSAIEDHSPEWFASEGMFDMAVTAYRFRSEAARTRLWQRLSFEAACLGWSSQISFDLDLLKRPARAITDATIESLQFANCTIGEPPVTGSLFIGCTFQAVTFDLHGVQEVGFLSCRFHNCRTNENELPPNTVWTAWNKGCEEYGGAVLKSLYTPSVAPANLNAEDIGAEVLRQFWPPDKQRAQLERGLRALLLGFPRERHADVNAAIDRLQKEKLLTLEGAQARLNTAMMPAIRAKLGR